MRVTGDERGEPIVTRTPRLSYVLFALALVAGIAGCSATASGAKASDVVSFAGRSDDLGVGRGMTAPPAMCPVCSVRGCRAPAGPSPSWANAARPPA
jgi:hypothetical protein